MVEPPVCSHEKTTDSSMVKHGVKAVVTVCASCSHILDFRPLKDRPDTEGPARDVAGIEARIQSEAKIKKAQETGLTDQILEESGVTGPLPDTPPADATGPGPAPDPAWSGIEIERGRSGSIGVPCAKRGGRFEPCDTGARKAHHCHHSKWGALRTFNGPCACRECHVSHEGQQPGAAR